MRKTISSRIISTGPFVERRFRKGDSSSNRCRRFEDFRPLNPHLRHRSNLCSYSVSDFRVIEGMTIDFYA